MELSSTDVSSTRATPRAKLAWAVLTCLLVWPPAQHMLHRAYRISPWKLLGLGVYCRPKLTLALEVRIDGNIQDMRGVGVDASLSRLHDSTRVWGVLARPEEAGCAILEALHPASGWVAITRSERDLTAAGWIREDRYTWHVNHRHCPSQ